MISLILLALASDAAAAWQSHLPSSIAWASATTDNDRFWIKADDVDRNDWPAFTAMVHGEHGYDPALPYKSSLSRLRFYCNGTFQLLAQSTVDKEGRKSDWTGEGEMKHVTPGTVYDQIQHKFCTAEPPPYYDPQR